MLEKGFDLGVYFYKKKKKSKVDRLLYIIEWACSDHYNQHWWSYFIYHYMVQEKKNHKYLSVLNTNMKGLQIHF